MRKFDKQVELKNSRYKHNLKLEDLLEGKEGLLAQEGMRELASLLQVRGEGAGKTRGMMKSRIAASNLILDQLSKLLNSTLPR